MKKPSLRATRGEGFVLRVLVRRYDCGFVRLDFCAAQ
jgi:hypothetical protein